MGRANKVVGKVNSTHSVNPFGSISDPAHQRVMAEEMASFYSSLKKPVGAKVTSIAKLREQIAVKRALNQSGNVRNLREATKRVAAQRSEVISFSEAAKRAGFNETQLGALMEGYKELLLKFKSAPLVKLNATFLMYNLPKANEQMRRLPNSVIVAFANFAANNRTRFTELQRKTKKAPVGKAKKSN